LEFLIMYTEEQALRILRRNTVALLAVIVALAIVAVNWIMRDGTGLNTAPFLTMAISFMAALAGPVNRLRREDPQQYERLMHDEVRTQAVAKSWRNGMLGGLLLLPVLTFALADVAHALPLATVVACTGMVVVYFASMLWYDRG
jgi:hypothetical protein